MGTMGDPFELLPAAELDDVARESQYRLARKDAAGMAPAAAATGVFQGFDLDDRPTISGIAQLRGEVVTARTTIQLRSEMIGSSVVVLFEQGDLRLPIIVGVLQQSHHASTTPAASGPAVSIQADEERFVISAEREIVLRCGDSSITLTRAGKVIIKGNYILSRSTGYNKIKGAAVDIN